MMQKTKIELRHSSPTTGEESLRSRQEGTAFGIFAKSIKNNTRGPLLFAYRELSSPVVGEE
jgi:hypothetical protein